jgi:hypothetical protein
MSIPIPQPSMALNAPDAPGTHYRMWNTWEVPASDNPEHILSWTATVADGAPGGRLNAVVINCHGIYNNITRSGTGGFGLSLGTGIFRADTPKFSKLKGKVTAIWITACGAARISIPGTSGDGDGNLFCSEIARNSGAYVYASTVLQYHDLFLGTDRIDDYEGLTLRYSPAGVVDWSYDYGQSFLLGLRDGWN